MEPGLLLLACIIIVGCVPHLMDSQAFASILLDGCSYQHVLLDLFLRNGYGVHGVFNFSVRWASFVSMAWLVSDVLGHKEFQLMENMWSVFSIVINCLNYVYNRYEPLHRMTTIFLNPIQQNQRIQ